MWDPWVKQASVLLDKELSQYYFEKILVPSLKQTSSTSGWEITVLQMSPTNIRQTENTVPTSSNNNIVVKFLKILHFLGLKTGNKGRAHISISTMQDSVHN